MLKFCTGGGKEKQKRTNLILNILYNRNIGSNKLYRYPDDYIDLIIMTKF